MSAAPTVLRDIEHLYCGSVFPGPQYFEGCETALCLFSAAWHGRQDAYWIAKYGMRATCVDLDGGRLEEMRAVYPEDWTFSRGSAFLSDYEDPPEWASETFDVLTLDPFTNLFERCASHLPIWCSMARRVVVLGHGNYRLKEPAAPEGWSQVAKVKRSDFKGGIYWLAYARD